MLQQCETYAEGLQKKLKVIELFLVEDTMNRFGIFSLDKRHWWGMGNRGIDDHDWYAEVTREWLFIISYPWEQRILSKPGTTFM